MREIKKALFALVFLVTVFGAVAVLGKLLGPSRGSVQEGDDVQQQMPVADYAAPETTDPKRKAKNERHKGRLPAVVNPSEREGDVVLDTEWWMDMPALPVAHSDAVVVGEVTGSQAHLTGDKLAVYSEFSVRVEEVLKNDPKAPIALGSTVIAERGGGGVRFANGKIKKYLTSSAGVPRVNGRYVLFLKTVAGEQGYNLLTGYELRSGKIAPLDSPAIFRQYTDADEATFLQAVRSAVAQ